MILLLLYPPQSDVSDYTRANVKQLISGQGEMSLQITKVNGSTGEIAGVFESEQPSSTDLGAEEPEEVKVRGVFYGRIETRSLKKLAFLIWLKGAIKPLFSWGRW